METCGACASPTTEFDRFCGDCGAQLTPDDPPPEPAASDISGDPRKTHWGVAAALSALLLVVAGACGYYFLWTESRSGKAIRLALKDLPLGLAGSGPEATPTPTPRASPSELAQATETERGAPTDTETAVTATPDSSDSTDAELPDGEIEPGNWAFSTLLFNVTKVDLSDTSFSLNREGIGMSERSSQCISPAIAASPRVSAFPLRPSMGCRASSFSMTGNRYHASLTCNFPQYGGERPVEADGSYSPSDISVDFRVRVPAQVMSGDFPKPPEIYLHYRLTGHRTQPC